MEVDATIQEEFVEDDIDYIAAMKLAVSDDEDGGGDGDSRGSRLNTTTKAKSNQENGGCDMATGSKRKWTNYWLVAEGNEFLGFSDLGKPEYAPDKAFTSEEPAVTAAQTIDDDVIAEEPTMDLVPVKKSRTSEDGMESTAQVSVSPTSSTSTTTTAVSASMDVDISPATAAPIPPAVADPATPNSKPKLTKEEMYKQPSKFGWKREVVYRANADVNKDKADIYYIAPSGKKMRSRNEIIPHLDGDLTIENFTFAKEPLGLSPDLEIVRSAKPIHRANAEASINSSVTNSGKRISKPKAPKGASPPPHGWTPTRALKNSSSLNTNSNSAATGSASVASPKSTPKTSKSRKNNNAEAVAAAENDVIITNERSKRNNSASAHRKNATSTSTMATTAAAVAEKGNLPQGNNVSQAQQTTRLPEVSAAASLTFASNFFANVSVGYDAILYIFKYLKIHERPRAASVCKIWNLVSKDRSLWQTVRMKNSKVSNWAGFAAALRRGETKHLDLRKLLVSSRVDETWSEFCQHISTVVSLEHIDMCRCSAAVVETIFLTNPNLTILSALAINDVSLSLVNINNLLMLKELRLRTLEKCTLENDLSPLRCLKNLQHLTLSTVRQLGTKAIEVIGELDSLVSLELGECNDFDSRFTDNVLPKLSNLERLRLEIGQEQCRTLDILDSVAKLEKLNQLEFVNFDIKPGFDDKLAQCTNIRKLLIIPTYISQSATTNNIVLNAVLKLRNTLQVFTWGVTVELLRVTALYVDQCEDSTKKERRHFDECIPVLKPVPGSGVVEPIEDEPNTGANAVPQIEILPLDKVEEILRGNLSTTKFNIVKVPFHATWKQQLVE